MPISDIFDECQKFRNNFEKIRDSENGKFHNSRNLIWLILTWTWSNFILLILTWLSHSQCESRDVITRDILDYIICPTEIFSKNVRFCRDMSIIKKQMHLWRYNFDPPIRFRRNICPIILLNILWQFNFLPNKWSNGKKWP